MKKKLILIFSPILIVALCLIILGVSTPSAYAQTQNYIIDKMENVMSDIDEQIKENPDLAMSSNPYDYVKDNASYNDIVNTGIKAVKPLYDILYDSRDAGLYEYILALAVCEITQQEYVYRAPGGWSNSIEFRLAYEREVNNAIPKFERILDKEISDDEKIKEVSELGVFAVEYLLDEYDKEGKSKLSNNVVEKSLENIIGKQEKDDFSIDSIADWRTTNEDAYRSLKQLNSTRYPEKYADRYTDEQ